MSIQTLEYVPGTYLAFKLADRSRSKLMRDHPPQFDKTICHHVTIVFGLTPDKLDSVKESIKRGEVKVTGLATGEGIECFTVKIDGVAKRLDGGFYHITHSLTPPKKPFDSNALLKSLNGEPQKVFEAPIELHGTFELLK